MVRDCCPRVPTGSGRFLRGHSWFEARTGLHWEMWIFWEGRICFGAQAIVEAASLVADDDFGEPATVTESRPLIGRIGFHEAEFGRCSAKSGKTKNPPSGGGFSQEGSELAMGRRTRASGTLDKRVVRSKKRLSFQIVNITVDCNAFLYLPLVILSKVGSQRCREIHPVFRRAAGATQDSRRRH
jgi:hypothetical protein